MKTETKITPPDGSALAGRPPPIVHPSSEPEYDLEQLARRASKVTDVLEHILHERPAVLRHGVPPPSPPV